MRVLSSNRPREKARRFALYFHADTLTRPAKRSVSSFHGSTWVQTAPALEALASRQNNVLRILAASGKSALAYPYAPSSARGSVCVSRLAPAQNVRLVATQTATIGQLRPQRGLVCVSQCCRSREVSARSSLGWIAPTRKRMKIFTPSKGIRSLEMSRATPRYAALLRKMNLPE
jgi:hypothetical protein